MSEPAGIGPLIGAMRGAWTAAHGTLLILVPITALAPGGPFGCGGRSSLSTSPDASTGEAICPATSVPVVVTTGPQSAFAVVVDATNVYWTNWVTCAEPRSGPQGQVMQCSKCGCAEPTVLATGAPFGAGIAVDATSVYWTNGNVMKVPIGGGESTTLAVANAGGIAVDATSVYWTDSSTVMRVPLAGGNPTTLATGLVSPGVIAVDAANLYWSDAVAGTITRADLDGGNPTVLATGQSPSAIAVDAESVYWTNFDGGEPGASVAKVAIGGGSVTTLASGLRNPYGIAVDATTVYFTSDAFYVNSVPKGGGQPAAVFPLQGPPQGGPYPSPMGVAVDATSLYWTDAISGAVTRLTVP